MPNLIRCTEKLRREMGLTAVDLAGEGDATPLGDWYANLFSEERKKCVLFAAERSLLTVVAIDVTRAQLRGLRELLREGLFNVLLDEGFSAAQANPLLADAGEARYGVGQDRSMTSTVGELVGEARDRIYRLGGVEGVDLRELHHDLNRVLLTRNSYNAAVEVTHKVLGSQQAAG